MTPLEDARTTSKPLLQLTVLGQFSLRHADARQSAELTVRPSGQRLLAFLALRERPVSRSVVTDLLWGDSDEQHASWSLRTALHRLPKFGGAAPVESSHEQLALRPTVQVDIFGLARRALRSGAATAMVPVDQAGDDDLLDHIRALERDVLPDWHEEWVIIERERHRQLRLHALESLARQLIGARRYGLAVHAGLAAAQAEPLRESAHRVIITAHLAQGNAAEALRQYGVCRRHLLDDLGIAPSRSLQDLVFRTEAGEGRRSMSS